MLGSYAAHTAPQSLLENLLTQLWVLKGEDAKTQPQETAQDEQQAAASSSSALSLANFSIADYSNYLPKTSQFLSSHLSPTELSSASEMVTGELREYLLECNLGEVRVADIGQRREVDMALVARSFCELLQVPFSLLSRQVRDDLALRPHDLLPPPLMCRGWNSFQRLSSGRRRD
jgi:hypothetical protein